jgi:hypothetical protein
MLLAGQQIFQRARHVLANFFVVVDEAALFFFFVVVGTTVRSGNKIGGVNEVTISQVNQCV